MLRVQFPPLLVAYLVARVQTRLFAAEVIAASEACSHSYMQICTRCVKMDTENIMQCEI